MYIGRGGGGVGLRLVNFFYLIISWGSKGIFNSLTPRLNSSTTKRDLQQRRIRQDTQKCEGNINVQISMNYK